MNDILWLKEALHDLDDIGSYIALDNERAAAGIIQRILEAVAILSWHPKLGRIIADGDTRRLIVTGTPYIAFYRLRERIEVLAILHNARRFPDHFRN
jgi:addiction module RelE/StbE family toxin